MSEPMQTEEQPTEGLPGATEGGLDGDIGQSAASEQITDSGPGSEATFYDPREYEALAAQLPDDLKSQVDAFTKSIQAGFTKKSQEYAANRHKIEAYDAFEQNPQAVIQQLAQQYGFQLQGNQQQPQQDWEPQNWDEVISRTKEETRQEVLKELAPYLNEVKTLKEQTTEQYFDTKFPDWRTYEDTMRDLIKNHPTLAKDPDTLYRMAVPPEVLQSRATKAALKKIETQSKGAQVSGQSSTTKPTSKPTGKLSFNEAVQVAKTRLTRS